MAGTEQAAVVVSVFASIARPIMRKWMTANSCIGAVRTTIETMKVFGLQAVEVPVSFVLQVPDRGYARLSGFSAEERAELKAKAAAWRDDVDSSGQGWNGHLLALVEGRWLLDPSIDQADAPEFGVAIPQEVFVVDTAGRDWNASDFQMHCGLTFDDGVDGKLMYRKVDDTSYRETEAWTDDSLPFLADHIAMQMTLSEMWRKACGRH